MQLYSACGRSKCHAPDGGWTVIESIVAGYVSVTPFFAELVENFQSHGKAKDA
jgi:hypothetical protein